MASNRKSKEPGRARKNTDETAASEPNHDLVVVGSSAGGVAALSVLVNTLSTDFPAPLVLAQHLDPQRASHLASILERQSKLPIMTVAEQQATPMQPGTIYVVPANRDVIIEDSTVRLESDHDGRPIPSVDRLLSSAAKAYGEHLIAVILTGSGSDGAAGAVDVKEAGGVVIIQNPKTAPYPSMPQSLPPTVVDHIVEIEQIGPLLSDLLKGIRLSAEKVEDPLRDLLTHVSQQANMDFRAYKPSTILRRISRRMAIVHAHNLRDYTDFLRAHPEEVTELVRAFLINVTGFFRDHEAFEFLKEYVVPDLLERGRENGRLLRAWSAGCSTGEEAYSIAILMAEVLGSEISEWNIKIFATDLDDDAVSFARRGLYPAKLLSDLPSGFAERYFERIDHGYRVSKSLRQMVIFGSQDLTRGIPFPRMDLVVCRNLLIYLKPELQQDILDLFAYSLHQTLGYLFLGKAETARPSKATFDLINKKWKVYRCLNGPMTLPAQGKPMNARHAEWQAISRRIELNEKSSEVGDDITPLRRINEVMFRYLPVGIAVVDRTYRIMTVNAAARRLLSIRDLAADQDFLHTARGLPYAQVRQAIDAALADHSSATLNEVESDNGTGRFLSLTIMPAHLDENTTPLVIITVTDVTEAVVTKRRLEDVQNEQSRILEELGTANKRLTSINTELQEANEELQSTNEELMLTQEELQATNEEFEATNEELQATNEELETNNEELQATNEELQTTNDELTARSTELQEMTHELSSAREKLKYMVKQFPYWVIVTRGPQLEVESYSARYAIMFGDKKIKGSSIDRVFDGEGVDELLNVAKEAMTKNTTISTPPMAAHVPDDEALGSQFVHTMVPIPDSDGGGLIIFTENITDRDARRAGSSGK